MTINRTISILLLLVMCVNLAACDGDEGYVNTTDYNVIYSNVENVNKTLVKAAQKETLLEFEEYSYCSYMMLFPRETPDNLGEFYFRWKESIDYDNYSIYFTYTLEKEDYENFKDALANCTFTYGDYENQPIYTDSLFEYPAYILTWTSDSDFGGISEYLMLDDQNRTVINVYRLSTSLSSLDELANYAIMPKDSDFSAVYTLCKPNATLAKHSGFSVYSFPDGKGGHFFPHAEDIKCNIALG